MLLSDGGVGMDMSTDHAERLEPVAAERIDDGRECGYECDSEAEFLVEVRADGGTRDTFACCQSCSRRNRIYAVENELIESEIQSETGD